jgi:hypothetical protein
MKWVLFCVNPISRFPSASMTFLSWWIWHADLKTLVTATGSVRAVNAFSVKEQIEFVKKLRLLPRRLNRWNYELFYFLWDFLITSEMLLQTSNFWHKVILQSFQTQLQVVLVLSQYASGVDNATRNSDIKGKKAFWPKCHVIVLGSWFHTKLPGRLWD